MLRSSGIALGWALAATLILTGVAFGVPAIPFSPYGIAQVDGAYAVSGTSVTAWCGGEEVRVTTIQSEAGASWYVNLDIPGDDSATPDLREGCLARETVTFRVGTAWATQAMPWTSTSIPLTLTASTGLRLAPVAPMPGITLSGGATRINIPADTRNVTYEVWRGAEPYFVPGSADTSVIANAPTDCPLISGVYACTDTAATIPFTSNTYYLVRAGNATNQTVDSVRVGHFNFDLQPGN